MGLGEWQKEKIKEKEKRKKNKKWPCGSGLRVGVGGATGQQGSMLSSCGNTAEVVVKGGGGIRDQVEGRMKRENGEKGKKQTNKEIEAWWEPVGGGEADLEPVGRGWR